MYLRSVEVKNIRVFESLRWELSDPKPGWHTIIGDNGSGKSTFLKAVSLALYGPDEIRALREDWSTWVGESDDEASVTVEVNSSTKQDRWAGQDSH